MPPSRPCPSWTMPSGPWPSNSLPRRLSTSGRSCAPCPRCCRWHSRTIHTQTITIRRQRERIRDLPAGTAAMLMDAERPTYRRGRHDSPASRPRARRSNLVKCPPCRFRSATGDDELEDAVDVAQHGREMAAARRADVWDGIIPAYGMLGFLVAFAKVGKTTFGQAIAAHIASGRAFLDRPTTEARAARPRR